MSDAELKSAAPQSAALAVDDQGRRVMLFNDEWSLKYFSGNNDRIIFLDSPSSAGHPAPRK
jgi:hypothetical protein